MNSFGQIFRVHIFGESHGAGVGIVIDGVPPGIPVSTDDFTADISRRKGGKAGTTPRTEEDIPEFLSGIFNDHTTGAPLTIWFKNQNTRSQDYDEFVKFPRPGHADLTAKQKFKGYNDFRGGGHFSGRLTVCLVAAGVIAKKIIPEFHITATLIELGGEKDIEKGLEKALEKQDSVGGIIECRVKGLPAGLGEPFFNSVESLLSHAIFSIPAVKGIEFGAGFGAAKMFGSEHNDAIADAEGHTQTNHSGGINGGLTNGNELVFRIVIKPASSTPQEQQTFNTASGKTEAFTAKGRHDLAIALRAPVVVEAVTAIVLADLCI